MEKAVTQMRTFMDKISTAARGYSGLFDAVKINEKELAQIYAFDVAFFELGDQISHALDTVESSVGGDVLKAAIRNASDLARQAGENYDRRYQTLTGSAAPAAPATPGAQ